MAAAALAVVGPILAEQTLTRDERAEVADNIVEWRHLVFGDAIRWNWCRPGALFWDDSGRFIGKRDASNMQLEVRNRSDCPKEYKEPDRLQSVVEVDQLRIRGDSIFVTTAVSKPGTVVIDEYRLLRDAVGSITVREYRIVGATARH